MSRDRIASAAAARMYARPPGGDSQLWNDGCPVDAGTAMLASNDLTHRRAESMRQLLNEPLQGALTVINSGGWLTVDEDVPPAADRTLPEEELAWTRQVARCWGPFTLVRDNDQVAPGYAALPRAVRFKVRCKSNGSAVLTLYVAATTSRLPPAGGALACTSMQTMTTTSATATWLACTLGMRQGTPRSVVASADNEWDTGSARPEEYWLWLGWKMVAGSAKLLAVSAWELDA
jgi:hypothetical protein